MKEFIDLVMEAMRTGVVSGYTFSSGSYYYIDGQWYRGKYYIEEEEVRAVLTDWYTGKEHDIEDDRKWIERGMREDIHRLSTVSTS